MQNKSRAFTLIELLVVVLIIGILAAVAVPQYQKAVTKSRILSMLPLLRAAKEANEAFYLANGSYATTWDQLAFGLPSFLNIRDNDAYSYNNPGEKNMRVTLYGQTAIAIGAFRPNILLYWNYRNSGDPDRLDCYPYDAAAEKICSSLPSDGHPTACPTCGHYVNIKL